MRVELTNGNYAVVRDADTIRNREVRDARRATDAVAGPESKDIVFMDKLISDLLIEWSLGVPLPEESPDVLEDLSPGDYRRLVDAVTAVHNEAREGVDAERNDDPASPTGPLSD